MASDPRRDFIRNLSGLGAVAAGAVVGDGAGTCTNVIQCAASWTGSINGAGFKKAGSATFILDNSRGPWALAAQDPPNNVAVWPPDPLRPIAGALVVGGAAPSISYGVGLTVTRPGVGQYRFTLTTSMDGTALYDVMAVSNDSSAPSCSVTQNSASQFDVFTRNSSGTLANCAAMSIKVFHSP
jgi:hypothetical protein